MKSRPSFGIRLGVCLLAGLLGASFAFAESSRSSSRDVSKAVQWAQEEIQDPFRVRSELSVSDPGSQEVSAGEKILLQGVGSGPRGAYALINGEMYALGEEKKGIKLVEARRGEADIWMNGELLTLSLVTAE